MMELPYPPFQWSVQLDPSPAASYAPTERIDRAVQNAEGKSRLRGPILPDPGYGDPIRPFSAPGGVGRALRLRGSDAKNIYKRATASDGAPYFVNARHTNMYHTSSKAGQPTKNYLNENVKRIRRIMRESQQRQSIKIPSKPEPVKALWQSKKYDHVQSAVKQKLEQDRQRSSSRPASAQGNFLRAHAYTGPALLRSQSVTELPLGPINTSVDVPIKKVENQIKPDYVKINSRYVKNLSKTRKTASAEAVEESREKQEKTLKTYQAKQKGRTPNYIEKIKEKREQDIYQAILNAPDIDCPPGHRKVENEQRLSTLGQLQSNRTILERKLAHLPVRSDSLKLRQTKEEIEKKLVELDEAIQIFSKPKVFLKIDE